MPNATAMNRRITPDSGKEIRLPKIIILVLCYVLILLVPPGCKVEAPIGKWKDGIVPYYLSGDFKDDEVDIVKQAMGDWEAEANVRFIEVTPRASAYQIIKVNENTWSSSIGENNSKCRMIFGSGGNTYSHVLHELGHALGLLHEHQRPDRDLFVTIFFEKLLTQYIINYDKQDNPLIIEENYSYDYNSIMHYPANSFSRDGSSPTMESTNPDQTIDRLGTITDIDAQKIIEIYGLPQTEE
jgi:astacin (peptidase family M12A)